MLYEYYSKSLSERLKELVNEEEFMNIFIELEIVFDSLIKAMIKATISIDFIAIDDMNRLKVWVKPEDMEWLGAN